MAPVAVRLAVICVCVPRGPVAEPTEGSAADPKEDSADAEDLRVRFDQVATIVGLLAFAVCTVVFKLDVGFTSIIVEWPCR